MDRFIVLAVVMMLTLLFALKSNMDRFIGEETDELQDASNI